MADQDDLLPSGEEDASAGSAPSRAYSRESRRAGMGLCLSGGGYRAALFHLGALRRLNEVGLLSQISTLSSVSGGSIANGVLAAAWPELRRDDSGVFTNFEEMVERPLRAFCSRDLRSRVLLWWRLDPRNWRRLLDGVTATNILAEACTGLTGGLTLQHLTDIRKAGGPRFVFCATNLQTGVNFELNDVEIGDYLIGYTPARDLPLGVAIAASAAFPIAFPPYVLQLPPGTRFVRSKLSNAERQGYQRRILLTDGGVYDNMGLEPVWKDHDPVLCSDGGAPFERVKRPKTWFFRRLLRAQDAVTNQARAVRKRWLMTSFSRGEISGAYWGITTEVTGTSVPVYRGELLRRISVIRTDLNRFSQGEQLVLMNHGWSVCKAVLRKRYPTQLDPEGTPPNAELMEYPGAAAQALG